jgi:hypothetical protein
MQPDRALFSAAAFALSVMPQLASPGLAASRDERLPGYFAGKRVELHLKLQLPAATQALLENNRAVHHIYTCAEVPGFAAVVDALPEPEPELGPRSIWQEVRISLKPGQVLPQFVSDGEILQAAAEGRIALSTTNEIYRGAR